MKQKTGLLSVGIALFVGALSAWLSGGGKDFYDTITRPPLSPPSWLFPIVWTALYILMGWAAARIFNGRARAREKSKDALSLYAASLIVNFFYSIFFFRLRLFLFSFFWVLLLEVLILATILAYRPLDKKAALSQIPYAVWVAFAGYLTLATYLVNP